MTTGTDGSECTPCTHPMMEAHAIAGPHTCGKAEDWDAELRALVIANLDKWPSRALDACMKLFNALDNARELKAAVCNCGDGCQADGARCAVCASELENTRDDAIKENNLLREAVKTGVQCVEGLAQQQAMPDPFYEPMLEEMREAIGEEGE